MKYTHIYDTSTQFDSCIGTDYSEPFLAYVKDSRRMYYNKYRNNHIDYVDMGYGVMWATCNIGAESPEQVGNLYMWGVENPMDPATDEEWYNYRYAESDGEGDYYITKYNVVMYNTANEKGGDDNILRGNYNDDYYYSNYLALEDDCVHYYSGGTWTLPTPDDISRLYETTNLSYETINNVQCAKLTSTINGNVLYFPSDIKCWTNCCDTSYHGICYGVNPKPRNAETQYDAFGTTTYNKCTLHPARGVIGHYSYPQEVL